LSSLALSLVPESPPPHLKRDLLAQVRAGNSELSPSSIAASRVAASRPGLWWTVAPYVAASLCAVFAGALAVDWFAGRQSQQAALVREFDERLAAARQTFESPRVRLASLDFSDDRAGLAGYLVWDILAGQVHFLAFDLGLPSPDHSYHLWFVTRNDEWVPAGKLDVHLGGSSAVVDLPPLPGDVARAVVTEEPSDAAASVKSDTKPQGPVRLIADFSQSSRDAR
jgi:hypothetical protein